MATASSNAADVVRRERTRILASLSGRGARDIRIFGSVARGDVSKNSDVDLLVDLEGEHSPAAELLVVLGLAEELSTFWERELRWRLRTLRPEVRAAALAEAVAL